MSRAEKFKHCGNPLIYCLAVSREGNRPALIADLRWSLEEQLRDRDHTTDREALITLGALLLAVSLQAADGVVLARNICLAPLEMMIKTFPWMEELRADQARGCPVGRTETLFAVETADEAPAAGRAAESRYVCAMLLESPPPVMTQRVSVHAQWCVANNLGAATSTDELLYHWRHLCRLLEHDKQSPSDTVMRSVSGALETNHHVRLELLEEALRDHPVLALSEALTSARHWAAP